MYYVLVLLYFFANLRFITLIYNTAAGLSCMAKLALYLQEKALTNLAKAFSSPILILSPHCHAEKNCSV